MTATARNWNTVTKLLALADTLIVRSKWGLSASRSLPAAT